MNLGGCSLPWATPKSAPIPCCAIQSRSYTSHARPPPAADPPSAEASAAQARARSANSVGVRTLLGSLARSRAKLAASASPTPRSAPRRSASTRDSSNSTSVTASTSTWSSSGFLCRRKAYRPSSVPSAIAWAQASGSRPAMPAPWVMEAMVWQRARRKERAAPAEMVRTVSSENFSCFPRPVTSTRGDGILPSVWISVNSPSLPRQPPSWITREMAPSSALSTAPVPPPGRVTPSNKLTTRASAAYCAMSPRSTRISMKQSPRRSGSLDPDGLSRGSEDPRLRQGFANHRVRLDLHQHLRIEQAVHGHQGAGRPHLVEELAVRPSHLLPVLDIDDIDARTYDIAQAGAGLRQSRLDVTQDLNRLGVRI